MHGTIRWPSSYALSHQRSARRVVRPMNLGVTIDAAAGEQERARSSARQACRRVRHGRVPRAFVTRLAQKRRAHFQKRRLRGTMWIVAIGAVLRDRLVFPQKRPAKFSMAGSASFGDGVLDQLSRSARAMRRVARRTRHLPFAQGMMRGLEKIRALRLMTRRADLDLHRGRLHRILGCVQSMAAGAGDIARGVDARRPIVRRVRLMAAQTLHVLHRSRRGRLRTEVDHAGERSAPGPHMRAARSVTGLALQTAVAERPMGIVRTGMFGAEDAAHGRIAVTAKTGIRSLRTIGTDHSRRHHRRPRCWCRRYRRLSGSERRQAGQQQGRRNNRKVASNLRHSTARSEEVARRLHITGSSRACAPVPRRRPHPNHGISCRSRSRRDSRHRMPS
jgi:hypothetical protein